MILLSVDVESWVHRPVFNVPLSRQTKALDGEHVLRATRIILELFKKYRAKATFFVLGTVAEWYPELIEAMKKDGHEIGIHGYTHTRLSDHTRESFDDEIKKTILILNRMGVGPRVYRAPAFSSADFLYEVLSNNGIACDSSVFPIKTPLYDGTAYDCRPFIIDRGIVEVPCSVLKISKLRVPAGGFYLRLLGGRINHILLKKIEKKNGTAVLYFHPWEILDIPDKEFVETDLKIKMSFLKKTFTYYGIPMLGDLEYLLGKIDFTSFEGARGHIDATLRR
ncbi:MAG: polysaccharide deacetylase family protein [Nitrospirae bacterium]|nr:polysaccharide deacetylase family protein [Nitrospirota bacterium]